MSMEPITLFARIADLARVARLLRKLSQDVEFEGPDDQWRSATLTVRAGDPRTLRLNHDPEYHSEPNWSTRMDGMREYFSRFPATERRNDLLMLPTTFRLSLGILAEPDFEPEGDPRLDVLYAVAEILDGVLFTPSSLRDAKGRILFGAGGEDDEDPEAVWPKVIAAVSVTPSIDGAPEEDLFPPSAERVARRALALTALTARAVLEQEVQNSNPVWLTFFRRGRKAKAADKHKDLLAWVRDLQLDDEFEPEESEVLQRSLGRLDSRQQINATWRLEGLVVLAWAMRRSEIPPPDQLVSMDPLWKGLGFLDAKAAEELLTNPTLRSREEINTLRNRLFAIHWRLRNFDLRYEVMDFADFAKTCWFGPLDLTGMPLVKGDLGLLGRRIDHAPQEIFNIAHSASRERHQASNWLWEGPDRYSDASAAT